MKRAEGRELSREETTGRTENQVVRGVEGGEWRPEGEEGRRAKGIERKEQQ